MHVPKHFWADAVSIACFLINWMPSSVLNWDTSYHIIFPNKPLFPIEPWIFGCTCFVRNVRSQVSKLDHKSLKYIFLGYFWVPKGYWCYCPSLRRYLVYVDFKFFENVPFSSPLTHTSQRGGKRCASVYYCLPYGPFCSCSSKASYHLGLHSMPKPTSLWSSIGCFDIRSSY